ncbi:molybdenum cofactor guanylyltransferase MobA [Paludibacterium purpuratum]|uniref:Molybdenum cofactor guanylyltransferase n=1 Tax=Paludibacterium purpuratum TaxID=1144873 RepID=A0A4V3DUI8_9NEIS|nr:molybdenum cofactor guanylyltransferase MobA [Paludibacterium purpuratum]TDR73060.1 molybdenum cofactor guanylyltransferase [Paludibacterium purpuratum]
MTMPVCVGPERAAVAGLLLAGGAGRRMGGVDKGWQLLAGRALVEHVLDRLAPQVGPLWLSANRSLERYRSLGLPVLPDDACWTDMGPLAGLATLAPHLPPSVDFVQLAPCDTPLLPTDLVARLYAFLACHADCAACYPQTSDGPEPVMLLLRRAALSGLPDYLRQGGRSLRGWLAACGGAAVPFDASTAFANANDPDSLQRLDLLLRAATVRDSGA